MLFGTLPIFLIIFALLGFAAGVKTMLRTAAEMTGTRRAGATRAEKEGMTDVAAEARKQRGFAIHPMDQFVINPLFGGDRDRTGTPSPT